MRSVYPSHCHLTRRGCRSAAAARRPAVKVAPADSESGPQQPARHSEPAVAAAGPDSRLCSQLTETRSQGPDETRTAARSRTSPSRWGALQAWAGELPAASVAYPYSHRSAAPAPATRTRLTERASRWQLARRALPSPPSSRWRTGTSDSRGAVGDSEWRDSEADARLMERHGCGHVVFSNARPGYQLGACCSWRFRGLRGCAPQARVHAAAQGAAERLGRSQGERERERERERETERQRKRQREREIDRERERERERKRERDLRVRKRERERGTLT